MNRRLTVALVLGLLLLAPRVEAANWTAEGFDLWHLPLSIDQSGLLLTSGSSGAGQWSWWAQAGVVYGGGGLLTRSQGGVSTDIVRGRVMTLVRAGVYVLPFIAIAADIPYHAQFTDVAAPPGISASGVGDLNLRLKFVILDPREYPVGLAIIQSFSIQTSDGDWYRGSNHPGFTTVAAFDGRIGPVYLGLNAGFLSRRMYEEPGFSVDDQVVFGLGLGWTVIRDLVVFGEISGNTPVQGFCKRAATTPITGLLGAGYTLFDMLRFELAGGRAFTSAYGTAGWLLGLRVSVFGTPGGASGAAGEAAGDGGGA